jgi:enhancing lycopene biosynthesis protein 2
MPRIAVILSGCGSRDGAEVQESVLTLLEIDRAGCESQCFAPDIQQEHVVSHLDGKVSTFRERNVLEEAARIARGDIAPLADARESDFDAVILPGGQGVIKNLSNFAFEGHSCAVDGEVERFILSMYRAKKPIGAECLASVLIARILGGEDIKATVTIGNDKSTAEAVRKCGAQHVDCKVDDIVVDKANKVVTTPAYMYDATTIGKVDTGISKMVNAVVGMINQ